MPVARHGAPVREPFREPIQRWPSPARREPQEKMLRGHSVSVVAGQVHGRVRAPLPIQTVGSL